LRTLPEGLQDHLDSGATTLCWCWRLTRADGVKLGFTDHDRDLNFDGTNFEAASGFTATEIASSIGLNVDNLEVEGALKSNRLSEADLIAGLYDNATVEIFRVNWADPSLRVLMQYGNLGEVVRGQTHFKAELRGLAHELNQPKGRIIQPTCDADLGDARCTIDLEDPAFKGEGTVAEIIDERRFLASGLDAFDADWFTRGLLTWTSGGNAGCKSEVKLHSKSGSFVTIELWQATAEAVAEADGFTVTAGCDKEGRTCFEKFANLDNFRGFPHVPGVDFALAVPGRGKKNDGRSMN
jgi:uncharacterized phage protein (TIGR02218 family)